MEQFRRRRYNQRNRRTLEEGVRKKKTTKNLGTWKGGGYFSTRKKSIQDITATNKPHTELVGEGIRTIKLEVDIEPLVLIHVKIIEL